MSCRVHAGKLAGVVCDELLALGGAEFLGFAFGKRGHFKGLACVRVCLSVSIRERTRRGAGGKELAGSFEVFEVHGHEIYQRSPFGRAFSLYTGWLGVYVFTQRK